MTEPITLPEDRIAEKENIRNQILQSGDFQNQFGEGGFRSNTIVNRGDVWSGGSPIVPAAAASTPVDRRKKHIYKRRMHFDLQNVGTGTNPNAQIGGTFYGYSGSGVAGDQGTIGPYHKIHTTTTASNVAGITGGFPANNGWGIGTHLYFRPLTFSFATKISPGQDLANSAYVIGYGDPVYTPLGAGGILTRHLGTNGTRSNFIGFFAGTDAAVHAVCRSESTGSIVQTDMSVTLASESEYIFMVQAAATLATYSIVNAGGTVVASVSQTYATAMELGSTPENLTNVIMYPLCMVQNIVGGNTRSMGYFWYNLEDEIGIMPESLVIGD